jgi:hypothetical protein
LAYCSINYQTEAKPYVFARMLFFKLLFDLIDGKNTVALQQQIYSLLEDKEARLLWTIQPVLDVIKIRVTEEDFCLLVEVAERINSKEVE